ncbi:unnamed protein product [Brassicogethes aeneus]|uniref:HTH OST-type domain-containing protein n=1 Tax=Brassicogethes aeneus TaxID=1431903 RepID=A0A9P0BGG2_BRAAE|nr:unnamed protein product [Brassicogethes aeneus]
MVNILDDTDEQETQIGALLRSIICLYGNDGLPLCDANSEFMVYVGKTIPYQKFGYKSLRDFVQTLPDIYIVKDGQNNDVLIEQSLKSAHIKDLILKQKKSYPKRRYNYSWESNRSSPKRPRMVERNIVPEGSFYHTSINTLSMNSSDRFIQFEQLESILPVFYKHQALGDEFFLDIADTKYGYYVPEKSREIGLCCEQTISELTEKVKFADYIAPRVIVMIGFVDLLRGSSVSQMISDLRQLVKELKKKNCRVTLVTLIPSPKLPFCQRLQRRMDIFNNAILDYTSDNDLQCNVIDMNLIFLKEAQAFNRDFDRFQKVAKKDPYKVFSDYGRKTFMAALRKCLREQIEAGH